MKANSQNADRERRPGPQYVLRRGLGTWEVTFAGGRDSFVEQRGAEYVVWLLLHPPPQPIHAVAMALEARHRPGCTPGAEDVIEQRNLGLDDAEAVRNLRRKVRQLEEVLKDERRKEPAKAEARRQREEIVEWLRKNAWRTQDSTQKAVRAVGRAIKRLHRHLAGAVDAEGSSHPVLRAFADHLWEHLLVPSGLGGGPGAWRAAATSGGCFTYEPPPGVVWSMESA
jgi:hypothetical protein